MELYNLPLKIGFYFAVNTKNQPPPPPFGRVLLLSKEENFVLVAIVTVYSAKLGS